MWITLADGASPAKLNTDFITVMYSDKYVVMLTCGTKITCTKKEYSELEKAMFPKRKNYAKDDTELAAFFNELHKLTGGKNEAIFTPQRKKKLADLIKILSREQLITAATYIGKDKWLQGENDNHKRYGDVDYLMSKDKDGNLRAARWAEYTPEQKKTKLF